MFPSLSPEAQSELEQLAQSYGQPVVITADLNIEESNSRLSVRGWVLRA